MSENPFEHNLLTHKLCKIADHDELPQGKTQVAAVNGREVLLCHTAEGYFAVDNLCSHAAARLCDGKLKGHRVLCPMHGGSFDVRDGVALSRPATAPIRTYQLLVNEQGIFVSLPDEAT
ncbi:MAG: non-heme iron oxygenase ferredoxin subunit [Gammaproteobacteria bacterium]|nr:non-heme iron oxygenase ferredoxin subunit [Gammaproteobacteria bacterium]